jgi:hypothetical protein
MQNCDINGIIIKLGDTVNVPSPIDDDLWNFEFEGYVESILDDYAIVCDGDGDNWCVEFERLEVVQE